MANFRTFFRDKIPELYFAEGTWIEKLTQTVLLPFDIFMQVLNYIPRLRDLKNREVSNDALLLEGQQTNMPKYASEPDYAGRILERWNIWQSAGSRPCFYNTAVLAGYTPDTTVYEYGVQERIQNVKNAYWAGEDHPENNRDIVWSKFYWGGYIDSKNLYAVHIIDPDGDVYYNESKTNEIVDICYRFVGAENRLAYIYSTDGSGNIVFTKSFL